MAIEGLKKHAGQLANTGVRVAVVFRKLPNDDSSCLIVETERLPDSYHDYLIQSLNSKEAAETNEFYEILNRRTFPDGANCLTALHQRGFLRKEPISNITMYPLPGRAVPLALINATIDGKVAEYQTNEAAKAAGVTNDVPVDTRTPEEKLAAAQALAEQMQTASVVDPLAGAKELIAEAEVLEASALAKRETAYSMAPDLKPGRGRPTTPDELKAEKLEERKEKRRERDRARAASLVAEKAETAINEKVAAKLKRDASRPKAV